MTYDMDYCLKACIARYLEVAASGVTIRACIPLFLNEGLRESPAGGLGVGPVRECPWCYHTGPPASFVQYSSVDTLLVRRKLKAEESATLFGGGGAAG